MSVAKRRIAPAPAIRTIDVGIAEGEFAGWSGSVAVGVPFRALRDLQSGDIERIEKACRTLVVELRIDGIVTDLDDADVFGVIALVDAAMKARVALPKR